MVSAVEALGLVAGLLIAASLVPQIIRLWRLKNAHQISLTFTLLNITGTVLWFTYGLAQNLLSVTIWNGTNTVLVATLLAAKLKYGMKRGPITTPASS